MLGKSQVLPPLYQQISLFLSFLSYSGKLLNENLFSEAITEGFKNEEFRSLVVWITNEISELAKMEEKVLLTIFFTQFRNIVNVSQFPDHSRF